MTADLHCHSTVSDGAFSPQEVMQMAHANGAQMIALTDHDHTGGLAAARQTAETLGMCFIDGVEISVTWRHRTLHIVGLDFAPAHDALAQLLPRLRGGRLARLEKMAEKLEKKGIGGAYSGALAYADSPETVGRVHVARFLIDNGYVKDKAEAFKKWLGDGKPAYAAHIWATLPEAVGAIRAAGGVAVIAHPGSYKLSATAMRTLIEEFKTAGGQGIEVACSPHSLSDVLNFAQLARRYDLYASRGSDFHGQGEYGCIIGKPPRLPEECRPVWQLFSAVQAA